MPRNGRVPAVPPIRSVFQSGMRCSTVLMTVLASMRARATPEAEVHPEAEGDIVVRPSDSVRGRRLPPTAERVLHR